MQHRHIGIVLAVLLMSAAVVPAMAAATTQPVDECKNADEGPGDDGPPSFVGSLMPDFLGDLFAGLPVPNFVKAFFGAPTC